MGIPTRDQRIEANRLGVLLDVGKPVSEMSTKEKRVHFFREKYYNRKEYKEIAKESGYSWHTISHFVRQEKYRRERAAFWTDYYKFREQMEIRIA